MTHYLCEKHAWRTRAAFVHLPLACTQVYQGEADLPSLPSSLAADALRVILSELA
jgi:pyrrolidone-carboxylate peptidase